MSEQLSEKEIAKRNLELLVSRIGTRDSETGKLTMPAFDVHGQKYQRGRIVYTNIAPGKFVVAGGGYVPTRAEREALLKAESELNAILEEERKQAEAEAVKAAKTTKKDEASGG